MKYCLDATMRPSKAKACRHREGRFQGGAKLQLGKTAMFSRVLYLTRAQRNRVNANSG
jgi:hypothetical protein